MWFNTPNTRGQAMPDDPRPQSDAPKSDPDADAGAACPPEARVPHMGQTGAGNPSPNAASRTGGATSGVAPDASPSPDRECPARARPRCTRRPRAGTIGSARPPRPEPAMPTRRALLASAAAAATATFTARARAADAPVHRAAIFGHTGNGE